MSDNKVVLVVEDEFIIAMDLQKILIDLGYSVPAIISSGEEAILKAKELKPDIVLMDIVLQGELDGIGAAEQIRSQLGIPVVYLTSYADKETVDRAKATEPSGYIVKPFEARDLSTTIEVALYRSKMEKKLRESEAWLSTILKSIDDGVVATDKSGLIKFMNPVARTMTGFDQEVGLKAQLEEVVKIRKGQKNADYLDLLLGFGNSKKLGDAVDNHEDYYLESSKGQSVPIDGFCHPIHDLSGNLEGKVFVFRDITEHIQAQKLMVEKRKMEAMGVMASGVAHEVNNPLSVVYLKTREISALLEEAGIKQPEVNLALEKIDTMILRISKITQDMLAFAKGNMEEPLESAKFSKIISDAADLLYSRVKNAEVKVIWPKEVPDNLTIDCFPSQLIQVVVNLVGNAMDAVLEKSEKWVKLEFSDQADSFEFSVTDSGTGIPEATAKKIFDPFFTTKGPGKGTGLGLAIIKNIIEAHQGQIALDQKHAHTRFVVTLPKRK